MTSAIFLLYAIGHAGLFLWATALFLRRQTPATVPLILVTAGLIYDNAMLALGGTIGFGEQLQHLSVPRYFLHAATTPLLIFTALGLVQRTGAQWSYTAITRTVALLLVVTLIGFGFWADMVMLELEADQESGIASYSNAKSIPAAPVATIVVLLAAGVVIWRRGGGLLLLVGALLQFAAAAMADSLVFLGNMGELALLAGLVWTDWKLRPHDSIPSGRSGRTAVRL